MSNESGISSGIKSKLFGDMSSDNSEKHAIEFGFWEFDLSTKALYWSDELYNIFKLPADSELNLDRMAEIFRDPDAFLTFIDRSKDREDTISLQLKSGSQSETNNRVNIKSRPFKLKNQTIKLYGVIHLNNSQSVVKERLMIALDELLERNKEQACLYNISKLYEPDHTVEELFLKTINYIQHGFQFPDLTEVQIKFDGSTYRSENYKHKKKRLTAVSGRIHKKPLKIDVIYQETENNPEFLREEQDLIDTIARLLSLKIYQKFTWNELVESRNVLQKILSQSLDIICTIDSEGNFVSISDAAETIWGYQPKELQGKSYSTFIYPEDQQITEQAAEKIMSGATVTNFDNRYVTKSGEIIPMSWSARWDAEDQLMYCVARDNTEMRKAEIAYQNASEERDAILESISDAFYALDNNWNIRYFNKEAERVLKYSTDEVLGQNFWEIFAPARDTELYDHYSAVMDNKEPASFEYYYPPLETWFDISAYPAGHGISVYFKNINDRIKTRRELEYANREKEAILESIGDGFFAVDRDWTVSYWNNKAEEILGKKKEDILGENLWEHYKEAVPLKFYSEYHRAMNENIPVHFEEFFSPLGKWFDVSAYPSNTGISVYFVDATERKKSQQKLKELNKSLEQQAEELAKSNAELEQFAFVASHDLQEPLRMITSFLNQLEQKYEDQLDERAQNYIHFATEGAQRMRQIILDLLDFSRVGRVDLEKNSVDLNKILDEVINIHQNMIESKKAVIHRDNLPVINASESHIKQLFQNLVSNSLKYQKKGNQPVIEVKVQEKKDMWQFSVTDNGIGIESKYHDKIFNIFQRLHAREEYSGTGVGLAICKKIVEQHGGDIWVESEVGKRSTFCFTIMK
jgi:PAS domain S-box-containing protein